MVPTEQWMGLFQQVVQLVQTIIHLDPVTLNEYAHTFGPWLYVGLFLIIFAETGLVVTPFLPGDSLLFIAGYIAFKTGGVISLPLLLALLIVAAVSGDAVNYSVGAWLGPKVFQQEKSWLFNKAHLLKAQSFYERWGAKTI